MAGKRTLSDFWAPNPKVRAVAADGQSDRPERSATFAQHAQVVQDMMENAASPPPAHDPAEIYEAELVEGDEFESDDDEVDSGSESDGDHVDQEGLDDQEVLLEEGRIAPPFSVIDVLPII